MADVKVRIVGEDKASQELKRVDSSLSKLKKSAAEFAKPAKDIKSIISDYAAVATTVAGAGLVLKGAFDLGKQGAQIEYTKQKFDNLAQSIGTTADALFNDLKPATGGILSDAELMASATDLMALGLAKTHDEAVRLTTVASALGMNMNQLVLTLTNQTTMRFDALGVSVDGFEAKVKKLEATGMSASDAFKEAFLQQAEDQIERVGGIAETSAGKIMRMEASIKNMGDAIKEALAGPVANFSTAVYYLIEGADILNKAVGDQRDGILETSQSYEEYARRTNEAREQVKKFYNDNWLLFILFPQLANGSYELVQSYEALTAAQYEARKAAQILGDDRAENIAALHALGAASDEAAAAAKRQADSIRGISLALGEVTAQTIAQEALKELNEVWEAGNLDMPTYKRLFSDIAANIAGMDAKAVNAQLGLFELKQSFDDNSKSIQQNIEDAKEFTQKLAEMPDTKYIDIYTTYHWSGLPGPSAPGNYGPYIPQGNPRPAPDGGDEQRDDRTWGGVTVSAINIYPKPGQDELTIGSIVVEQLMNLGEADRSGAFAGLGYAG